MLVWVEQSSSGEREDKQHCFSTALETQIIVAGWKDGLHDEAKVSCVEAAHAWDRAHQEFWGGMEVEVKG